MAICEEVQTAPASDGAEHQGSSDHPAEFLAPLALTRKGR